MQNSIFTVGDMVTIVNNTAGAIQIVKAINASVDIPLVSEKREEKWIGATWDIICDIIKPLLKKTL